MVAMLLLDELRSDMLFQGPRVSVWCVSSDHGETVASHYSFLCGGGEAVASHSRVLCGGDEAVASQLEGCNASIDVHV